MSKQISYNSTPNDLYHFIEEQLFQNENFVKQGKRKLTTCIYGSPGIGKTSVLEQFPLLRLETINSAIISSAIPNFKIKYKRYESIEEQNKKILARTGLNDKERKKIEEQLLNTPDTEIVMVTQADIIVAEDVSGLPSSASEFSALSEMYNLAVTYNDALNNEESKRLQEHFLKQIGRVLKQNSSDVESFETDEIKNTIDRNVTKFDFTEWEKKVHDIHVNKPHIKHIILVLDDITRAAAHNTAILNVLMPIFQQYTVGQRPLPSNCSVVVTSNEEESDNGKFNYVGKLDEAQTDRLFSTKVTFDLGDWEEHSRQNNVHESVILYGINHSKIFDPTKTYITPRRLSQFGEALYNKFGDSTEIFSNKADENAELLKTIKMQLGDPNAENYGKIITEYLGFLKNTGGDAMKFITELKSGFTKELKERLEKFNADGKTVTINILVHKLIEIIANQKIDPKFKKGITDFFSEKDLIPKNLLFTFKRLQDQLLERYDKFQTNKDSSKYNQDLIEQISSMMEVIVPELKVVLEELEASSKKVQKDLNDKK